MEDRASGLASGADLQSSELRHMPTRKTKQKHRLYCLETFQKMASSPNRVLSPPAAMSGELLLMVESNGPPKDRTPEKNLYIGVLQKFSKMTRWSQSLAREHCFPGMGSRQFPGTPVCFLHLEATYRRLCPIAGTNDHRLSAYEKEVYTLHRLGGQPQTGLSQTLWLSHIGQMITKRDLSVRRRPQAS